MNFVEISRLTKEKKVEILEGMMRIDRVSLKEWEEQVAIKDADSAAEATKVAINRRNNETAEAQVAIKDADSAAEAKKVAIKDADSAAEAKKVAIGKLSITAANLANTVKIALSSGIKLTPDYRETMKKIIAF